LPLSHQLLSQPTANYPPEIQRKHRQGKTLTKSYLYFTIFYVYTWILLIAAIPVMVFLLWGISTLIAIGGGSPLVNTPQPTARAILRALPLTPKDTLTDLGSGYGNVLVAAVKNFGARAVGYEISPFAFLVSRMRTLPFYKRIKLHYASAFEADLSQTTVIFLYASPKMIQNLFAKISRETKKGTKIITRNVPLPQWQPIKKLTLETKKEGNIKIFVYQVK